MNWQRIKAQWQAGGDDRLTQHPKNHRKTKKLRRQNRKLGGMNNGNDRR
jgi:hypothetical protein